MILCFSVVCSSFKEIKCVIQKLEDSKGIGGNLSDPKKLWKFCKTPKLAQKFTNTEK